MHQAIGLVIGGAVTHMFSRPTNERLKAQDAKIDKVNAKVELTKPVPQVVNNNQ